MTELQEEQQSEELQVEEKAQSQQTTPALVINIQSWAIPIVGLVMLMIGLVGGYMGRPLIGSAIQSESDDVEVSRSSTQPAASSGQQAASPESAEELMNFLNEETNHFRGDDEAQVTIVEFSDFQ